MRSLHFIGRPWPGFTPFKSFDLIIAAVHDAVRAYLTVVRLAVLLQLRSESPEYGHT